MLPGFGTGRGTHGLNATILTIEGGARLLFRIGSFSVSVYVYLCECESVLLLLTVVGHFWLTVAAVGPELVQPSGQNRFEHR